MLIEGTVALGRWSLTLAVGSSNETAREPGAPARALDAASVLEFDLAVQIAVRHFRKLLPS